MECHDAAAERAVLGSAIKHRRALLIMFKMLEAEDFYEETHRRLYKTMQDQYEQDAVIEPVTLRRACQERGIWNGQATTEIGDLMKCGIHQFNDYYCRIVRTDSLRRQLGRAAQRFAEDCDGPDNDPGRAHNNCLQKQIGELQQELEQARSRMRDDEQPQAEVIADLEREYQQLREGGRGPAVPTGLQWLDNRLTDGGIRSGHLLILGGRPSSGKTALAVNAACHAAIQAGHRVLFYTAEQSRREVLERALLHMSGLPRGNMIKGLTADESVRWGKAKELLDKADLSIKREDVEDIDDICADAEAENGREPVDLIIVDYIHALSAEARSRINRTEEVAYISGKLKGLAGRLDAAILAVAQLNRASGRQIIRHPKRTDLRSSGALEQDADSIVLICRYDTLGQKAQDVEPESADEVSRSVTLDKQRNGITARTENEWLHRPTLSWWDFDLGMEDNDAGTGKQQRAFESSGKPDQDSECGDSRAGDAGRDRTAGTGENNGGSEGRRSGGDVMEGMDVTDGEIPF